MYVYTCICICINQYINNTYIYIYITHTHMRKERCGDPMVGIVYVEMQRVAYARRYISKSPLFYCGETPLLNNRFA